MTFSVKAALDAYVATTGRKCVIEGCGRAAHARDWCIRHYRRWQKYGDPLTLRRSARGEYGAPASFLLQTAVPCTSDDCLMWPFQTTSKGYGRVSHGGRRQRAHRLVCQLVHGEPPSPTHEAAHSCGNPGCVNPHHLRWATPKENQADALVHGTRARGSKSGRAKLTEAEVLEIRTLKGRMPLSEIAEIFNVTHSTVSEIISRKSWSWL